MATKITTGLIANDAITSAHIGATAITHADLHTNMDLTGKTVLVANASTGDNDTTAANTAFVQQELAALVDSAPGTLNTLNELAAALGDDAAFSTTVTNSIATKLPLAGGTMTGNLGLTKEDPNITLTDSSASRTLAVFVDDNNSVLRSSGQLLLQIGTQSAITIDSNRRVGVNQVPTGSNFTLQVTGKVTDGTDGRAAYFKGYGTQTTIGGTGPTVVVQNANTTANNYVKLSFESGNAGETVSINAQNIDHTNHYGDMVFNTRGSSGYSEKMRIASNGNVGIGTTSAPGGLPLQTKVSSGDNKLRMTTANKDAFILELKDATGDVHLGTNTTAGALVIEDDGDVYVGGNFAVNNAPISGTQVYIKKLDANNNLMRWGEGTTGQSTYRFRIDQNFEFIGNSGSGDKLVLSSSSGNILSGKANSNFDTPGVEIRGTGELIVTRAGDLLHLNRISSDGQLISFRRGSSSTVGSINVTTTGTSYYTTSDERLKENIIDAPSASDDIDSIQIRSFDWKSDGSHQKYGMIAQEILPVAPVAVNKPEDSEQMMSIDYSKLVPMLIKEIQSLRERVTQLEEEK